MDRIIDLTERDDSPELLTSTTVSGLLGGGELLATDPLETYLDEGEEPKYALRNKKAGVEIDAETGTETVEPDDSLQSIALVTDLRLLVVVGQREGDRMLELPLSDVVEAKTEQGRFRTNTLVVTTVDSERWRFPSKADVEPFARTVDELAQPWTHAQRLLDESSGHVERAEDKLDESDIQGARNNLEDAETKIQRAVQSIREVGPAATETVESRARAISGGLLDVKRELAAADGARNHARAQENWSKQAYETAARQYERAIEAYETARSTDGPTPSDESLEQRLQAAVKERELLRVGPLVDADAARRNAFDEEDPEEAAVAWEQALDGYRELLTLDWGRETREFLVDKNTIREQTVDIADDAIEDHLEAGQQWMKSGDRLAVDGYDHQALEVYERAQSQFENAEQLASEVRPEQLDDIADALDLIEERLSGAVPDDIPDEAALDTVVISGPDTGSTESEADSSESGEVTQERDTEERSAERRRAAPNTDSPDFTLNDARNASVGGTGPEEGTTQPQDGTENPQSDADQLQDDAEQTEANRTDTDAGPEPQTDDNNSSVLDQIRAQKQGTGTAASSEEDPAGASDSPDSGAMTGSTEAGEVRGREQRSASETHEQSTTTNGNDQSVQRQLADLSEQQFETLVSELWESQGWSTTVMSVQATSAFDIVAVRKRPVEERLGIWTLYGPQEAVDVEDVAACRTALADSEGAEAATIVTTCEVTTEAGTVADEHDIAVVDTEELSQLLRFEGLTDRLDSLGVE
jgi:hypothetical protein